MPAPLLPPSAAAQAVLSRTHASPAHHSALSCMPPPPLQVVATAQALLANGGVMAPVGMHIAAMAAK